MGFCFVGIIEKTRVLVHVNLSIGLGWAALCKKKKQNPKNMALISIYE